MDMLGGCLTFQKKYVCSILVQQAATKPNLLKLKRAPRKLLKLHRHTRGFLGGKKESRITGAFVNVLLKPRAATPDTAVVTVGCKTLYFRKTRETKCTLETFL